MQESKIPVVLRNSLRLHKNILINKQREIYLYLDNSHLINHPFTELEDSSHSFNRVKIDKFYAFEKLLVENEYKVKVIYSKEEIPSTDIHADLPDGSYERDDLKSFNVDYTLDHNYLLKRAEVMQFVTEKMPFSSFRKLFENKAFSYKKGNDEELPRTEAKNYLSQYFKGHSASTYFKTRNQLLGENFSTGFSQYLNLGELHPQDILESLAVYEKVNGQNKSTYWIRFELLWREYFHFLYLKHEEDFFMSEGLNSINNTKLPLISISQYLVKFDNPLLMAMNKELMIHGTLSNRSRQIYASYLVHNTDLDWRYGAWFFQLFLKDYDIASNWGNWLYMAGVGTDARGPRFFKITKQMQQYDPELHYLKHFGKLTNSIWADIDNT